MSLFGCCSHVLFCKKCSQLFENMSPKKKVYIFKGRSFSRIVVVRVDHRPFPRPLYLSTTERNAYLRLATKLPVLELCSIADNLKMRREFLSASVHVWNL